MDLSTLIGMMAALQATPAAPSVTIIEPLLYYASGATRPLHLNGRNLESIRSYARRADVRGVIVRAHTDTVGSTADNLALAQQRAAVIRDILIADGVSASIIRIDAVGESRPSRPTADGVDEPLNRFVWVDIRMAEPVRPAPSPRPAPASD